MKAVVCEQFAPLAELRVMEVPSLPPGPGEAVVQVKAAGVNYPDALVVQGKHQYKPTLPFTPGGEFSGIVVAVGAGVTQFDPGQAVYGSRVRGAFAQQITVNADKLLPKPDSISFEEAAALSTTYNTAYYGLVLLGGLKAGETVLVLGGAGGVGLAGIQLAKACGARVIAAASSPEKLAICTEHGADAVIDYEADDLRQRLKDVARDGVDIVLDPVGGRFAEPALRSLAWRGRYLVVGFAAGEIPRIPLNLVLLKGASVIGVFLGESWTRQPEVIQQIDNGLRPLVQEGKLRPRIHASFSLEQVQEALQLLLDRKAVGKVVLLP